MMKSPVYIMTKYYETIVISSTSSSVLFSFLYHNFDFRFVTHYVLPTENLTVFIEQLYKLKARSFNNGNCYNPLHFY